MKKLIPLFALAFFACEEDPAVKPIDNFTGSWSYQSTEIPLSFSFDVVKEAGGHSKINHVLNYPTVPTDESHNHQVNTYEEFEENAGFGRIEIVSRGRVQYSVYMIYNRFDENGNIQVYDMVVNMPGDGRITLYDQVLRRR